MEGVSCAGVEVAGVIVISAVVLTHDRPTLARQTVKYLIGAEGLAPDRITLIVNGVGGVDDPVLARRISIWNTGANLGPAGGFAAALDWASRADVGEWLYVCEDDIGLLSLPTGRAARIIDMVSGMAPEQRDRVGAVVAYGRTLDPGTGRTVPHRCQCPSRPELEQVDAAAWGATIMHRRVLDAGVRPDPSLYFGFEDFDFFMRLRARGFDMYVDCASERAVANEVSAHGRDRLFVGRRPTDREEPWRHYYFARNFVHLARRYGSNGWIARFLPRLFRRWTLDMGADVARSLARGYVDGLRGRTGAHPAYCRTAGETSHEG